MTGSRPHYFSFLISFVVESEACISSQWNAQVAMGVHAAYLDANTYNMQPRDKRLCEPDLNNS